MLNTSLVTPYTCTRCLIRQSRRWDRIKNNGLHRRPVSTSSPHRDQQPRDNDGEAQDVRGGECNVDKSLGAMSRRLAEMTDETIESGGRSAEKTMEEAGFSEELKRRLEARIQETSFRNEHPAAFAQMDMPVLVTIFLPQDVTNRIIVQCWQGHATNCGRSTMVGYGDCRGCGSSNAYGCT